MEQGRFSDSRMRADLFKEETSQKKKRKRRDVSTEDHYALGRKEDWEEEHIPHRQKSTCKDLEMRE